MIHYNKRRWKRV